MGLFCMLAALLLPRPSGLPSGLLNELDSAVGTAPSTLARAHWSAEHGRSVFTCCGREDFQGKSDISFNIRLRKFF